jgi:hypothetical protein
VVSKGWGVDSMETEVWYKPDTPRIFKIPQGSLEIRGQLGRDEFLGGFVSFGWLRNTVLHRNLQGFCKEKVDRMSTARRRSEEWTFLHGA